MKQFQKYAQNPVFGSPELGTTFDAYVTKTDGKYRMDFSWRAKKSLAVTFSEDGIHWSEPQITLPCIPDTGWEDNVNRNCVLKIDGVYKMWYCGLVRGHSYIGYAESEDGIHFKRMFKEPIMYPERPWEGASVMNPCVLYEDGLYRMWYSAGETYEPNVLGYAESEDGIRWRKINFNPIFLCDENNVYEQARVGGCQVLKVDGEYYLFYIGYEDIDTARICLAKSKDGIINWERSPMNPLIGPEKGSWDADACYKPTAVWNEESGKWMIWYNGRTSHNEFIGMAECEGKDLFE